MIKMAFFGSDYPQLAVLHMIIEAVEESTADVSDWDSVDVVSLATPFGGERGKNDANHNACFTRVRLPS